MDSVHQSLAGPADGRSEYCMRPAPMGDHRFNTIIVDDSLQSAASTQDSPRSAQPDPAQIVDSDARRDEFVTQPAGETNPEVRLHVRAEVPQTSKRQQVGLDSAKEIAGRNVEHSHGEHPITAR